MSLVLLEDQKVQVYYGLDVPLMVVNLCKSDDDNKLFLANFQLRAIRKALFIHQDKKCHWCNVEMQEYNGIYSPTVCTLDHFYDRWEPELRAKHHYCFVAACSQCNNQRSTENQSRQPIEVLRERATRHRKIISKTIDNNSSA